MPITANVTNEQITASVGETQIDVTVSGGVGPTGAAGASSWDDITGKPSTFAPSAHAASHAAGAADELFDQDLNTTDDVTFNSIYVEQSIYTGGDVTLAGGVDFTGATITGLSAWRLFYSNGSGVITELTLGSSGQALLSNGASAAPSWGSAGSNSASDLTTGTLAAARIGAHASTHQTGGSDAVTNVVVSPSQITGNQNDYSPGTGDIVRLSSDAARNITGITAGNSGDVRVLVNVGSFTITLVHQSASSTAANRFLVSFGADYLLAANAAAVIVYDATTSRWRVI